MHHRQPHDGLARGARRGVRAVARFRAEHLGAGTGVVAPAMLRKEPAGARQDRFSGALGLGHGIDADNGQLRIAAETVHVGGADLVAAARRAAARAADAHQVGSHLAQRHLGEVAGDVGQQVGRGIADLVQDLLPDGSGADQPARARRLADREAAVGTARHHGIADVGPVRHALPVGMQPAGGLAAALDDMARQAALRQPVIVVRLPAELVHQHAQRDRAVDAAAGNHDLRALVERLADRQCAQVGVGADQLLRKRLPLLQVVDAGLAQLAELRHDVVALHHRDPHRHALLRRDRGERLRAAMRVDAAGIADHADIARDDLAQQAFHRHRDKVGGIAEFGLAQPCRRQDRHGQFGQVVEHEVIDAAVAHQLRRTDAAVAPEARGTADPNGAHGARCVRCLVLHAVSLLICRSTRACVSRGRQAALRVRLRSWRAGRSGFR
ncbi:hypothetical protein D3C81_1144400 [compost metagenome]